MNRKIVKLDQTAEGKAQIFWKPNDTSSARDMLSAEYDYVMVSAPFSIVKQWRLPAFTTTQLVKWAFSSTLASGSI